MPSWIVPSDTHVVTDTGHTTDHNHVADDLTLVNNALPIVSGGLTGATAAGRLVGATASGAPASGTFAVGDLDIDQTGALRICTAAGTPGTWVKLGQLDTTASDIQPVAAAAAAGSTGKAADAGHVHAGLSLLASTGTSGYTLVNGTGTIISWTAPNDGNLHRVLAFGSIHVTSAETGGLCIINWVDPLGSASSNTFIAAGQATGTHPASNALSLTVEANAVVSISQSSALTAGAAIIWAEIWGL